MIKKRNDEESMICLTPKPSPMFFRLTYAKQIFFFTEKELFKEKGHPPFSLKSSFSVKKISKKRHGD